MMNRRKHLIEVLKKIKNNKSNNSVNFEEYKKAVQARELMEAEYSDLMSLSRRIR